MRQDLTASKTLCVAGAFTAGFSVVGGLIVLFAVPSNPYATAFWLLSLGFLFLVGVIVFLVGFILLRKRRGSAATAGVGGVNEVGHRV